MRTILTVSCLMTLAMTTSAQAQDGFVSLFNGTDLSGWKGDPELWRVEDGCIVGTTDTKTIERNSFLATEQSFGNFVLRISFKLRNHNSGVQVRSKSLPGFVCKGYQPDIAERRYTGILYEEGGRGILADVNPKEVAPHFKRDGWNQYVITCDGPKITIELNGFETVTYTETGNGTTEGVIGLQLHQGPKMAVRFKDIQIRELP